MPVFPQRPTHKKSRREKILTRKEKTSPCRKASRLSGNETKEGPETSNSNKNQINVPHARKATNRFKMQAVQEVGVNLQSGCKGHLISREAGSVGGQTVKKRVLYER